MSRNKLTTKRTKKELLEALEKHMGIVTSACKEVGIQRKVYYDYMKDDPEFKAAVESLADVAVDFAESNLMRQIKDGNATSTIFYLKTKGKSRGYIERFQLEHSGTDEFLEAMKAASLRRKQQNDESSNESE